MSLEHIYYVSQTVAVVIIIATLVAVLVQMRQSNRLAKLESSRTIWIETSARLNSQIDDSEKSEFLQRSLFGTESLTEAEKSRFYLLMSSMFVTFENAHTMHLSGMMEARFWPRMRDSMRDYLSPERARRWWVIARKRTFGSNPEFSAEVDALLAEIESQGGGSQ